MRPARLPMLLGLLLCLASPAAAAKARGGLLQVKSTPTGAAVWVDGRPVGTTPTLLTLPGGAHSVSLALPSYGVQTHRLSLKRGKKKTLNAQLQPSAPLPGDARAAVQALVGARAGRLREWKALNQLPFDLVGGIGLFGRRTAGISDYDPELGLYLDVDSAFTGAGLTVKVDFYLDEALTQGAGGLTLAVSLITGLGECDYEVTAGPLAGAEGHLQALASPSDVLALGSGTMSDGTTWSGDFAVVYDYGFVAFGGGVDLTLPDAVTEHWSLDGTFDGTNLLATSSDGHRLAATVAEDGSGSALLENTVTHETLALVVWTAEGVVTITYQDGSQETIPFP